MSVVGSNALNCKVVLYNVEQTSTYNQDNMSLDVSMGCARIIFLNWFVNSVMVGYAVLVVNSTTFVMRLFLCPLRISSTTFSLPNKQLSKWEQLPPNLRSLIWF